MIAIPTCHLFLHVLWNTWYNISKKELSYLMLWLPLPSTCALKLTTNNSYWVWAQKRIELQFFPFFHFILVKSLSTLQKSLPMDPPIWTPSFALVFYQYKKLKPNPSTSSSIWSIRKRKAKPTCKKYWKSWNTKISLEQLRGGNPIIDLHIVLRAPRELRKLYETWKNEPKNWVQDPTLKEQKW